MTGVLATVRRLIPPERYDFAGTLGMLSMSRRDPTARISSTQAWWATRTPDGPGTLHVARDGDALVATGYGAGAAWLVERADAIAGLHDDPTGFPALAACHPVVHRLARGRPGWRFTRSGRVFQRLLPAILEQKVTGQEAHRAYHRILRHFGEPAPGPLPDLVLPPDPAAVAATPYWVFHPFGVEQRRADTVRRAAARAARLETALDSGEATRWLTALPGIGPWTAAEVVRTSHGDADAVSVGDYHLPDTISWALAGEPRGTDARMIELLEPFRGHRGRVCELIESAGVGAPRFGPRAPIRSFARF
jgi:3-methyladenine DNA glycosylase/8-oxoguanine DNA glycosylase